MKEIVPVIGYENLYMISDDGIVFMVTEMGLKAIKPSVDKDGYFRLTLCKNNKKKSVRIHRLVAESFIPNPENCPSVNHKDENKQNNSAENLEWCSVGYNNNYNGLAKRKGIKRQMPIIAVGKGEIIYFDSITEASKRLNLSHGNISSCLTGRRKTAGGMMFCYRKDEVRMGKKSVIYDCMDNCIVCGSPYVEVHHIFFGTANRKISDKYGYVMPLCNEHHTGSTGIHRKRAFDLEMKKQAQEHFEAHFGARNEFIGLFGKSYL